MIPLVDLHCHLLAGLDDGPRTDDDALSMCRIAYDDGIRMACATAHQNEHWSQVTPGRIREAAARLAQQLREAAIPLTVFPCAEVMARPDLEAAWQGGQLLTVADRGQWLLVEMPHGLFVDLRPIVRQLARAGIRVLLAHPERHGELLDDTEPLEELIHEGCLVQVSARSITEPRDPQLGRALRDWFRRGLVHVLGSDGHSPQRRAPLLADAYRQVVRWAGDATADRVCSSTGLALLQGLPVRVPPPAPRSRRWLPRFW